MIQHLNPQSFYPFGTILSERKENDFHFDKGASRKTLHLSQGAVPIYRSNAPCWVSPASGSTVLRVSTDGASYFNFYLDKAVRIHPSTFFSLSPILSECSAELIGAPLPDTVDHQSSQVDLRTLPKLRVDSLYTLFYQEKEQGFFFPGEAHPMLELTYVEYGSLHSVADGRDLLLAPGDIVLYGPNQWHMQYADIGVAPRYLTVSFDSSSNFPEELINRRLNASQNVLLLLQQMLREQESPDACSGDMQLALLEQLLITLLRSLGNSTEKLRPTNFIRNENMTISRAQQFISAHVRQQLTVPLVADHVDVSPSYLTALFQKHLQIAPGEYIRRIKLQESKQMIRENSMNFTQIATALQYSTVHHFSRQFKQKFGITPSEYAKSVR